METVGRTLSFGDSDPMNAAAQQTFKELMGTLSESDLEKLPLAYSVYREDFPALVELASEQSLSMPSERVEVFKALFLEAWEAQEARLEASLGDDESRLAEIERHSAAINQMAVEEYFFSMTYLKLGHLLQRTAIEARGEEPAAALLDLQQELESTLVRAFRKIDELLPDSR